MIDAGPQGAEGRLLVRRAWAPMRPAVVVTGISGNLGRALAKLLHQSERDHRHRPAPLRRASRRTSRCTSSTSARRRPRTSSASNDVSAVIHMGIMHDPRMSEEEHHSFNVRGHHAPARVLREVRREEGGGALLGQRLRPVARQLELPHRGRAADGGQPLPRRARPHRGRHARPRLLLEAPATIETVILRPVHIVGPTIKNAPSNYLRLQAPVGAGGFDPMVQLIHVEDVGARDGARRSGPSRRASTTWSAPARCRSPPCFRELGRTADAGAAPARRGRCSAAVQVPAGQLPAAGAGPHPVPLHGGRGRWTADMGWKPRHSMKETIRSVDGERAAA